MTLTLNSSRFGGVQVSEPALIDFPYGLIGLPSGRYALLTRGTFTWLQSVDDPGLALPVADPRRFFAGYAVEMTDHDATRLDLPEPDETALFVTIRISSDGEGFTANLRAPLLVGDGRGYQVINQLPEVPLRAPLRREGNGALRAA